MCAMPNANDHQRGRQDDDSRFMPPSMRSGANGEDGNANRNPGRNAEGETGRAVGRTVNQAASRASNRAVGQTPGRLSGTIADRDLEDTFVDLGSVLGAVADTEPDAEPGGKPGMGFDVKSGAGFGTKPDMNAGAHTGIRTATDEPQPEDLDFKALGTVDHQTPAPKRPGRLAVPACMVLGVLAALAIVIAWFPKGYAAWNYPLHEIDAPAHYYFIRKILDEGIGASTHLWPNDAFYPPMFHLLAAGLIKLAALFGITVNVYTALNVVWIAGAGLIWPASMQLLASYWTCRSRRRAVCADLPGNDSDGLGERDMNALRCVIFPCIMAFVVPLLAIASSCYPFQSLATGPLLAYGLATAILPFWIYATLRFFDAIANRHTAPKHGWWRSPILRWMLLTAFTGVLCLVTHPRIAFTWLLFIAPFLLLRMPWKLILGAFLAVLAGGVAFFFYMTSHYQSTRYFNPADWFHTYTPSRSVQDALRIFVTDQLPGATGIFAGIVVVVAFVITLLVAISPRMMRAKPSTGKHLKTMSNMASGQLRKDAVSVAMMVLLFGLVLVCSASLTGWFPNIVAAVWYRTEVRPLTMIPLALITLIVFAASAVCELSTRRADTVVALILVVALAVVPQFTNVTRSQVADAVYANMELTDNQPNEQLTQSKYEVLQDVARVVGDKAVVISDPLNGSMYGKAIFNTTMLFPIYNPAAEKNGAIFGAVERAFDSGNAKTLLNTVCPIGADTPEYFLAMGDQAPSLQMFTFKEQYDPFHKRNLISKYVKNGTLKKVRDYSGKGGYAKGWALYRFGCGD